MRGEDYVAEFEADDLGEAEASPSAALAPPTSELLDERGRVVAMKSGVMKRWVRTSVGENNDRPSAG